MEYYVNYEIAKKLKEKHFSLNKEEVEFIGRRFLLFPSKDQRDWRKFQRPFMDGDILVDISGDIYICKIISTYNYCGSYASINSNGVFISYYTPFIEDSSRYATEEEKQKLFDAIKANGYKWNPETKTLEKLVESKEDTDRPVMSCIYFDRENYADEVELYLGNYEIEIRDGKTYAVFKNQKTKTLENLPKFKVGDRVVKKNGICVPIIITGVGDTYYWSTTENYTNVLPIADQDDYELDLDKFDITTLKPFESRVLVRDINTDNWIGGFYSHYKPRRFYIIGNSYYYQCIPYEGNEHLLDTTKDCDEYYKNW